MSDQSDFPSDAFADQDVTSAYNLAKDPCVPAEIDRRVLSAAARAVQHDRNRGSGLVSWLRPLTIMATLGLSLALLLEFAEVRTLSSQPTLPPSSADIAPSAADALDAGVRSDQDVSALQKASDATRAPVPGVAGTAAEEVDTRLGQATDAALRENRGEPSPERGCTIEQRQDPEAWLTCIADLEVAGLTALAEKERSDLLRSFAHGVAR